MGLMDKTLLLALAYIESNLDKTLSIKEIAAHLGVSQYHFHRHFKMQFGLGLYALIKLLRLKRAAYQLAYRQEKVIDIAFEANYQSHEAFSRAFQQVFKQSPRAFRQRANRFYWQQKYDPFLALRKTKMDSKQTF